MRFTDIQLVSVKTTPLCRTRRSTWRQRAS